MPVVLRIPCDKSSQSKSGWEENKEVPHKGQNPAGLSFASK